ncbi:MAG: hypothetical protein AB7F72_09285 [Afipia sp.]
MDIETARYTVRTAFRVSRDLQETMRLLKESCSPEDYKEYAFDIAKAIDAVSVALLNKAIKAYPELELEIEEGIAATGQYL